MHGRLCVFCFLLITLVACRKVEQKDVLIIGHAASGLANVSVPFQDNTLEAINYAFSHSKCNGVELDLQLSADNQLILFHNTELSQNTNKEGCVRDYNRVDLITTQYKTLNKEKIAALDQVNFLNNKTYFLDIRHLNSCTQEIINVNRYISALSSIALPEKLFFTVSSQAYIEPFKQAGYTVLYVADSEQDAVNAIDTYNFDGVELRLNNISATFVESYKKNDFLVGIYDVRAAKSIQKAILMQPSFLSTDDIKRTINCLK